MELFIILSVLFIASIIGFKLNRKRSISFEIFLISLNFLSWIYLVLHCIIWSLSGYGFNKYVRERNSFEQTIYQARRNGSPLELATATIGIAEWNRKLAAAKYDNKVFLLKDYVDDRVDTLEPIK